jgi:hypothetical protein
MWMLEEVLRLRMATQLCACATTSGPWDGPECKRALWRARALPLPPHRTPIRQLTGANVSYHRYALYTTYPVRTRNEPGLSAAHPAASGTAFLSTSAARHAVRTGTRTPERTAHLRVPRDAWTGGRDGCRAPARTVARPLPIYVSVASARADYDAPARRRAPAWAADRIVDWLTIPLALYQSRARRRVPVVRRARPCRR